MIGKGVLRNIEGNVESNALPLFRLNGLWGDAENANLLAGHMSLKIYCQWLKKRCIVCLVAIVY